MLQIKHGIPTPKQNPPENSKDVKKVELHAWLSGIENGEAADVFLIDNFSKGIKFVSVSPLLGVFL